MERARWRWLTTRLRDTSPPDRVLLAAAWTALLIARIALRLLPVRRILAWQQTPMREHLSIAHHDHQRHRIQWAIAAATRHSPIRFVCFPQCLAASFLLRTRGIESRLHFGVTRHQGVLATHTWLESGGQILIGADAKEGYSTLAIYEPPRKRS